MAQLNIDCKVTFTAWFYLAKAMRWLNIGYPAWIKDKTIAWIVCGEKVRQIKLSEEG